MLKKYFAFITGIIVFTIYLYTLSPSISGGDSSELAAVQATLGIAHPTGYPLFTMIGYFFSLLPIPFTTIYKLNLLSAIFATGGIIVFYLISKLLLDNFSEILELKKIDENQLLFGFNLSEDFKITASAFGSFLLAFSPIYWYQSTSVEVYSLHLLLLNLNIYYLLKAYLAKVDKHDSFVKKYKPWILVSIFLAFGFTNHLTTVYLVPGIIYLFFIKNKFTVQSIKVGALMILLFIIVAGIIYLYISIRASQEPAFNWGNPNTIEKMIYHITGGQFHGHLFNNWDTPKYQSAYFIWTLFRSDLWQFNLGIFISLIGFIPLYFYQRKLLIFFSLLLFTNIIISTNYLIPDINAYFLLSYVILSLTTVVGLLTIKGLIKSRNISNSVIAFLFITIIGAQLYANYSQVDRSDNFMYADYTGELLKRLEKNAVIVTNQNGPFYFPSLYLQRVNNIRPDVSVICLSFQTDWYFEQIKKTNPDLIDTINNKFKFDLDERPLYLYSQIFDQFNFPSGYKAVPDLFLFKVVKTDKYVPTDFPNFKIRIPENRSDPEVKFLIDNIGSMLENRAKYELQFGKYEKAKIYTSKIIYEFPEFDIGDDLQHIVKDLTRTK